MGLEKKEDWEWLLGRLIYQNLNTYKDSTGMSIPCKVRENMEQRIIAEFKKELGKKGYSIKQ